MFWLDTTILVLLGVGAALGAWTGLLKQVVRVVGFGASLYGAVFFHAWAADGLQQSVLKGADPRIAPVLAYVVVFVAIFAAFLLTALVIERCLKAAKLKWLDRLLGAGVGAVKAGLILGAIFLVFLAFPHPSTAEMMKQSQIAPVLAAGVDLGLGLVPSEYTNDLKAGVDKVQEEAGKKAKEMADQKAKELRDQVTPKIP